MAWSSIKAAVDAIQAEVAAIDGIKAAPSMPTEQMADWPYVTTYPSGIDEMKIGPYPLITTWWDVTVEIHWLRQKLPVDMATALTTYPEAALHKIAHAFIAGNALDKGVTATFGGMEWGDKQTIGFQFKIKRLKIQTQVPSI